jgi:xylulokinase
LILAHDLGTTGNKATLVSNEGALITSVTVAYDTDFGPGGKAEQNPLDWWRASCEATRRLIERAGIAATDIDVISFSGQMMGVVPLDAHGDVVRPAIIWADTRSSREAAQLIDTVGMERGYAITGHRLNPTYSLSKVMWLRANEPESFARVATVVQAKDYVAYRLTGVLATDPSDASGTNAYSQADGAWSGELLDAAGLAGGRLFSDIVPSTTVIGTVTRGAAAEAGLVAGIPVVIGGGDGPMGALGAGIVDESDGTYAYLGSSSWVSLSAPEPLHDPLMRSMTFNHVIPDWFVPTATMQAGGASLQWIVDALQPQGEMRYEQLLGGAATVGAASDGLYFLPHLLGERSPYWNPRARAVFAGLARHHGPAHLTRAVLEGVAFNLRTGLLAFIENGKTIENVDAIGGAANGALTLEILSNVWGRRVTKRDLVDEATSMGAAVVAGVGVGIFPDFAVSRTLSGRLDSAEPDPATAEAYLGQYELFMDLYRRLESWFELLP